MKFTKSFILLLFALTVSYDSYASNSDEHQAQRVKFVHPSKLGSKQNDGNEIVTCVPTFDTTFRILFDTNDCKSKQRTMALLNSILFNGEPVITEVSSSPCTNPSVKGRNLIFDVKCTVESAKKQGIQGTEFTIEMQRNKQNSFEDRALNSLCRQISRRWDELSKDEDYQRDRPTTIQQHGEIKPVWLVAILHEDLFNDGRHLRHRKIMDPDTHETASERLQWTIVELKKFRDNFGSSKPDSLLEKWLFYLSRKDGDEVEDMQFSTEIRDSVIALQTFTNEQQERWDSEKLRIGIAREYDGALRDEERLRTAIRSALRKKKKGKSEDDILEDLADTLYAEEVEITDLPEDSLPKKISKIINDTSISEETEDVLISSVLAKLHSPTESENDD